MSLGNALIYSVLGLAIVFFALILLMFMTKIMVKVIPAKEEQVEKKETPKKDPVLAKGTAGEIKLNGVDPRTAAMCMAIVADNLKKPINELRFISIKEVEE